MKLFRAQRVQGERAISTDEHYAFVIHLRSADIQRAFSGTRAFCRTLTKRATSRRQRRSVDALNGTMGERP